jgi:hypothetical protein
MALGLGEGSEMRAPMAITVIGGLLTSTLLTLLVVPVMYTLLDRRPYPGTAHAEFPLTDEDSIEGDLQAIRLPAQA